jgi:AraC family transcriptional regulator of adaptative response/methylated-DNA-[protein]-cysteine methyltransferase
VSKDLSQNFAAIESDPRWKAVMERDSNSDGLFYYSVATTGIYCNPSCSARQPRPENVKFHLSQKEAQQAGYRPCKRCKPEAPIAAVRWAVEVERLCRFIELSNEEPSLEQLAHSIGASPSHTQRTFKRVIGVTPKEYAAEHRRQKVRSALVQSSSVTEAIYASGYRSSARFYDSAKKVLGMHPQVYRSRGKDETIHFAIAESSLGGVLVAATEAGVCAILLGDDPQELIDDLARRFSAATLTGAHPGFDDWVAKVVGLVECPSLHVELPLDIRGTAFQHKVWKALIQIPSGKTTSYSELASCIGSPTAARAVAGACAANPLAVVVPCHRVVRRDGGISGYRWGVEKKRELLRREREQNEG